MPTNHWKLHELKPAMREQAERILKRNPDRKIPGATADLQPAVRHDALAKKTNARFNGPVDITVFEYRHKLPDHLGSSIKYIIDALVSAGILPDDNRKVIPLPPGHQVFQIGWDQDEHTDIVIQHHQTQ